MALWLVGDCRLTEPLSLNEENKTVVIMGAVSSEHDITLKVKNLILLGKISTAKDLSIQAGQDIFNVASVSCRNFTSNSEYVHNGGLNEKALTRLRTLGIEISILPTGNLNVQIPRQGVSTINEYLSNQLHDLLDWLSTQRSWSEQIGLRSILVERITIRSPSGSSSESEAEQHARTGTLRERRFGNATLPISTSFGSGFMPPQDSPPDSPK